MMKRKLTLSVDDELISFAKKADINISEFLEDKLAERFGVESVFNEHIKSLWVKKKQH